MLEETKSNIESAVPTTNKSGILKSVANHVLSAVGVGVLALPRAITGSGWAMGVLLLLVTWVLSQSMMHLLWKCIMTVHAKGEVRIDSYGGLGAVAFGSIGKYCVAFATYTGLTAICILLLILLGMSLLQLTEALTEHAWRRIAALVLLPLSWLPSLKEVGILSTIGVLAVCLAGVVVLVASCMAGDEYREKMDPMPVSGGTFAMSFLEFMNSYTIAPVIPTIILGMKDATKFPKVSTLSFAIISGCFAVIGFAGYFGWCDILMTAPVGINQVISITSGRGLSIVCQISILVVSLSHFLVMFNPVALMSDGLIGMIPRLDSTSRNIRLVLKLVGRSALVGIMLAGALYVPSFMKVVDLLASTVVLPLQVIFPILFYCVICTEELTSFSAIKRNSMYTFFGIAITIAFMAMGYGLYNVISHW